MISWLPGCEHGGGSSAPTELPRVHEIQGVVTSFGHPVSSAQVRLKGQMPSTETNRDGRFRLKAVGPINSGRVTASKPGYFIAGVSVDSAPIRLELRPLPDRDHEPYAWVNPTPDPTDSHRCGNCHEEIYEQWNGGGHAVSATNPHFLDLYAGTRSDPDEIAGWGLLTEYPEGAGVCTACHLPAAHLAELGVGDLREIRGVARHGVHCDFCHKVQDVELAAPGLTHGRFAMKLLRPAKGQLFFGPLDDVDRGEDSYLPLQSKSQFCAGCHEGIIFGVPVYTTYSEWLASPARVSGKQCQSCHMKPDEKMTNLADGFGGMERNPTTLASHVLLPGGRAKMLRRCLGVTMNWERHNHRVTIRIKTVTRDVGHRVPTGFVDRHLILVVEAFDIHNNAVDLLSGPTLPASAGNFTARPGIIFAKHLVDEDGYGPVPFWRAGATFIDNRLQPDAARTDSFEFDAMSTDVRVRLLYRRFWQPVAVSKGWEDSTITVFQRHWQVNNDDNETRTQ